MELGVGEAFDRASHHRHAGQPRCEHLIQRRSRLGSPSQLGGVTGREARLRGKAQRLVQAVLFEHGVTEPRVTGGRACIRYGLVIADHLIVVG